MTAEKTPKTESASIDMTSDEETDRALQETIAAAEQDAVKAEPPTTETADLLEARSATDPAGDNSQDRLNRILSMRMPVIVKIAEKATILSSILKLNLGSVINFDKDAYQLVDLMVNNSTIGLGQAVKIGENFGLKITQIGPVEETIKSLGIKGAAE